MTSPLSRLGGCLWSASTVLGPPTQAALPCACHLSAVVDFYRQLGFEADPEGIKGMFW